MAENAENPEANIAEQEEEEVPDNFFDDLLSNDFIEGLNVIDQWDNNKQKGPPVAVEAVVIKQEPISDSEDKQLPVPDKVVAPKIKVKTEKELFEVVDKQDKVQKSKENKDEEKKRRRDSRSPQRKKRIDSTEKKDKKREKTDEETRRDPEKRRLAVMKDKEKVHQNQIEKSVEERLKIFHTGLVPPGMEDTPELVKNDSVNTTQFGNFDRPCRIVPTLNFDKTSPREKSTREASDRYYRYKSPSRRVEPTRSPRRFTPPRRVSRSPLRVRRHSPRRRSSSKESDRELWLKGRRRSHLRSRSPSKKRRSPSLTLRRRSPSPVKRRRSRSKSKSRKRRSRSRSPSYKKKHNPNLTFLEEIQLKLSAQQSANQTSYSHNQYPNPYNPSYNSNANYSQNQTQVPGFAMPYTAPSQYASQPQTVAYQHLTQNTPAVVDNGQPMTVSYLHLNKVASVPNSHQISQNLNNPAVASQLNKVANDSITMDLLNKLQGSNVTSGLGPSQVGSQFSNAPRIVDAAGTSIQAANIPMDTPSSKEVCFKLFMDGKISINEYLTYTKATVSDQPSQAIMDFKMEIMRRSRDVLNLLKAKNSPLAGITYRQFKTESKPLPEFCSPMKLHRSAPLQFNKLPKEKNQLFSFKINRLLQHGYCTNLDVFKKTIDEYLEEKSFTKKGKELKCCECEKRRRRNYQDMFTQTVDKKVSVSIGTQVSDQDFKTFDVSQSFANLTPAQLMHIYEDSSASTSRDFPKNKKKTPRYFDGKVDTYYDNF